VVIGRMWSWSEAIIATSFLLVLIFPTTIHSSDGIKDNSMMKPFYYLGHPINLHLKPPPDLHEKRAGSLSSLKDFPKLLFEISSLQSYLTHKNTGHGTVVGYSSLVIPTNLVSHEYNLQSWKPHGTVRDEMWDYFIGGANHLRSLDYINQFSDTWAANQPVALPPTDFPPFVKHDFISSDSKNEHYNWTDRRKEMGPNMELETDTGRSSSSEWKGNSIFLSKFGFATVSSGSLRLRVNTALWSHDKEKRKRIDTFTPCGNSSTSRKPNSTIDGVLSRIRANRIERRARKIVEIGFSPGHINSGVEHSEHDNSTSGVAERGSETNEYSFLKPRTTELLHRVRIQRKERMF